MKYRLILFLFLATLKIFYCKNYEIISQRTTVLSQWKQIASLSLPSSVNEQEESQNLDSHFSSLITKLYSLLKDEIRDSLMPDDLEIPIELTHMYIYTRDKIPLSTFIINPKPFEKKKSILLSRSPYGPTSDQLVDLFLMITNGEYVAVIQDQRGTAFSGGEFDLWRTESNDAFDTIKVIEHETNLFPWFDGHVFSFGVSADGCSAVTQVLSKPAWLKGQFIVWATGDSHSTLFPGGSYREGLVTGYMTAMNGLTHGTTGTKTIKQIKQHEAMSAFYKKISLFDRAKWVNYPTIQLSGWWDIFNHEQIQLFKELRRNSHKAVRNEHKLVVGPLGHCIFHELPRLEFFEKILRAEIFGWTRAFEMAQDMFKRQSSASLSVKDRKRLTLFVMGPKHSSTRITSSSFRTVSDERIQRRSLWPFHHREEGNFWISLDEWPSSETLDYFLSSEGRLGQNPALRSGSETLIYDPLNPAVTDGGNSFLIDLLGYRCGSQDQISFESRPDYLTFTTQPLKHAIGICGEVKADLVVSSDRNDTDFVAALTDVYEHDSAEVSMLVNRGVQNMKWRESPSKPVLMQPNHLYEISFSMGHTCYIFNKGHKIRLSITSSSWPLFRANKNFVSEKAFNFLKSKHIQDAEEMPKEYKNYSPLKEEELSFGLIAKNSIHYSKELQSKVSLPFVSLDFLKKAKVETL